MADSGGWKSGGVRGITKGHANGVESRGRMRDGKGVKRKDFTQKRTKEEKKRQKEAEIMVKQGRKEKE